MTSKTLAEDFTSGLDMTDGYSGFMAGLLSLVNSGILCQSLGNKIQDYALSFVETRPLTGFNRYSDQSYIRNYLGRDKITHWEALVMSWKKGNRTAIHSHPQFAGYTFADGEFLVEIFEPCEKGICLRERLLIQDRQGLFAIGQPGQYDNHIHRITCLSDTAHSLHIYSDDALKGLKYAEPMI